ncbi:hypothetical protein NMG60_11012806 [Bertholletia excelsa]
MSFQLLSVNKTSKLTFFLPGLICVLLAFSCGFVRPDEVDTIRIGAIIDSNSRIGKEQKVAMQIAVQNFNNTSTRHKLDLHFHFPGPGPLRSAYAAEELIKEDKVQVIIGMERWQEAVLVAEVGSQAQVPVLSLVGAATTPPLVAARWPFVVQMATNISEEVNCIEAVLQSYKWRRVITIYEEDRDSGMMALLSEALQSTGLDIEHSLVFPPFSFLADPEGFVQHELTKVLQMQSRVFIVLQSSLNLSTHLFREAKQLGLLGRDSAWIITDAVSSLLDSVNSSAMSPMRGALGIGSYYSDNTGTFLDFKNQFQKSFQIEYPEEDNSKPGIHALRAYDGIQTIAQALENLGSSNRTPEVFLRNILSSSFVGLSGNIRFNDGSLSQYPSTFRIINVVGKVYNELGFWSSEIGFSESPDNNRDASASMEGLWSDSVSWPGKLKNVPKGWAMPSDAKPMRIAVPGNASSEQFVKVVNSSLYKNEYSGFCIDVFEEVLDYLDYPLTYEFELFYGSYNDLVDCVANKTYDAVVGDVTILSERWRHVEFTQPYTGSGLSMVVPVKFDKGKAWMFMKPFTKEMWIVTGLVFVYTMAVVWFLEHQSNDEFRGPLKNQLSAALWFTFCSLFFAHREKIHSNYARVVVAMWLFVVYVVTSNYQASLTSILTVRKLEPNVTDIQWLKNNNAKVGCDGDSFVKNYLSDVMSFKRENIIIVSGLDAYPEKFEKGDIVAAFLELPYQKVFLRMHCDKYSATPPLSRFGGLGFVFQKGSPVAADVSEAILKMSENGRLRQLEEYWLYPKANCPDSDSTSDADSLPLQSFRGLYTISIATSSICLLLFLIRLIRNHRNSLLANPTNVTPGSESLWRKMVGLFKYFGNGSIIVTGSPGRGQRTQEPDEWSSDRWEMVSPSEIPENFGSLRPTEIEIPIRGV